MNTQPEQPADAGPDYGNENDYDYDGRATDTNATTTPPPPGPAYSGPVVRRLYRGDGPISGVAAGLADYFNVDASLIRLALAAGTLLGGPVVPIGYIAAWIIIPRAEPEPAPPIMAVSDSTSVPASDGFPVPPSPVPPSPVPPSPVPPSPVAPTPVPPAPVPPES